VVCHRNDNDQVLVHAVYDRVRKMRWQDMFVRVMLTSRLSQRCLGDTSEGGVDLARECNGREWTTPLVERLSFFEVDPRFRMKL
jgi:hypothetical protein